MQLDSMERVLWLLSFLGHLVLVCIIALRRRYRVLPFFSAFIAGELLRNITLFFVYRYGSKHEYFFAYWSLNVVVDVILQTGVVYELASGLLRPANVWPRDLRKRVILYVAAGALVAIGLTALATGTASSIVEAIVMRESFFTTVLLAELYCGMLVIAVRSGLPWRGHVARVALTFGFFALFVMLLGVAHDLFGKSYSSRTDVALFNLQSAAYVACLVSWAVGLWKAAPARFAAEMKAPATALFWAQAFHKAETPE